MYFYISTCANSVQSLACIRRFAATAAAAAAAAATQEAILAAFTFCLESVRYSPHNNDQLEMQRLICSPL